MTTLKDLRTYLREMYVTLKLDDSGCRIHSVSDGDKEIVTNESRDKEMGVRAQFTTILPCNRSIDAHLVISRTFMTID